jgi:hypothetical protein
MFCSCGTKISSSANIVSPRCARCCRLEREARLSLKQAPVAKPLVENRETSGVFAGRNRRLGRVCRHCWPNDCGCHF